MSVKDNVKKYTKKVLSTLALPAIVYIVLGIIRPDIYFSFSTFIMMLTQAIPYAMIGWAMLFGMSVGLFDFSVGARLVLASLIGVYFAQSFGVIGFILGCVLGSVVLAALTGIVYAGLKIPSIITGFAALLIFESLGVMLQNQFSVIVTDKIRIFGTAPGIYIMFAVIGIIVYILYNNTRFGSQIKAIGGNEAIAKSMGIKAVKLKLNTYIIGGLFVAAAAIVRVGFNGSVIAMTSMSSMLFCFTPMMCVMIGLFLSSCNDVIGTYVGAFCITVVSSGLVALNIESRLQNVVVGSFLLIFIAIKMNQGYVQKLVKKIIDLFKRKKSVQ